MWLSATHMPDHENLIPSLFKDGANCPIYVPKGCKKILTYMWQDANKIFEAEYEKYGRKPIYTQRDIDIALSHVIECDINKKIVINEHISFIYYNAQHIVRACQVYMELNDGVNIKKLGFTGDISNNDTSYYLNPLQPLPQVDLLIGECTYSNNARLHKAKDRDKDIDKLDMAIRQALSNKSKVLIPTFSFDRLETILTTLYIMYEGNCPISILCDTPLGKNISDIWDKMIDRNDELWDKVKNWDKKRWVKDYKDRLAWSKIDEPMLIIGSGGFLKAGTSVFWTKLLLPHKKNRIIFCGYSSTESTAGKIKSGELTEIKLDGIKIPNKASTTILNSFSSHMDYEQLLDYYTKTQYTKICLVHSNQDDKIKFAEELRKRLSKANRTSKVIATNYETKINF